MNGIKAEKDVSSEEDEVQMTDPQFIDLMQQLEGYTPTVSSAIECHKYITMKQGFIPIGLPFSVICLVFYVWKVHYEK